MTRRRLAAALSAVLASVLLVPLAGPAVAAPTQLRKITPFAGWETPVMARDFSPIGERFSSAAVADLDGDGRPEIVTGFVDGHVYVWRTDGSVALRFYTGDGAVQASPTIADVNRDGRPDIVAANLAGDVVAFDVNGRTLMRARVTDNNPSTPDGVFGTPVVADIGGQPAVIVTGYDQRLHAYRLDGSEAPGFPFFVGDTIWSSPSVADLDRDGRSEIIFGFDCDGAPGQRCAPTPGGYVAVVHDNGRYMAGWPRFVPGQVVWSSPAVADLDGDGGLDIVVGTGNMPASMRGDSYPMKQTKVFAYRSNGADLPGWPVEVGHNVTSSPAVGDLDGNGRSDVAVVAENGEIIAIRGTGQVMWRRCTANDPFFGQYGCPKPLHGSVTIADVMGDGNQEVVSGGEQWLNVVDGRSGEVVGRGESAGGTTPMTAAPTIANVDGRTWIVEVSDTRTAPGLRGRVFVWTTDRALGRADWPTFKHDSARSGSVQYETTPPTVAIDPVTVPASTGVPVRWRGDDAGGVASFDLQVSDNGQAWQPWRTASPPASRSGTTAAGSAELFTIAGHAYKVRARARDTAGNVSGWVETSFSTPSTAAPARPFTTAYAVGSRGTLSALDSTPVTGPGWGYPIARGVATRAQGGGWVLDGWGAMHPFGGAPGVRTTGYWPGQDITRGVAVSAEGDWGYVVDLHGAIFPVGGAPSIRNGPYWAGRDVVRGIALDPNSTKAAPGGWILDLHGGLHAFGSASYNRASGYWAGQDVVRGLAVAPGGAGQVVDWFGGLHPTNGAQFSPGTGYFPGRDVVRGVALLPNQTSAGYVLDDRGGLWPFGGAPAIGSSAYSPGFDGRGVVIR